MTRAYSGMPASKLDTTGTAGWRKPWSGSNGGACVETLQLLDHRVAMRQSTDPGSPALIFDSTAIKEFVKGARDGLADFLTSN